jgi:Animal haem peroxidase
MSKSNRKSTASAKHRQPAASAKHRQPAASAKHRQPAASAKEITKISVTGAGFQRADRADSGGRCAGARAGYPLSAVPVEAQYIVRAGVLAFALGIGSAVGNTPAVAFAAPTDASSSSSSSDSSSSTSNSSSESAANTSSTDPTSSTGSSALATASSSDSTSENAQSSVDSQTSSTFSPRHASTADPRSGVVQNSGGARTGAAPSSSDTTASGAATPTQTGTSSADDAASPATQAPTEQPTALAPVEQPTAASPAKQSTSGSPTGEPAAPAPSAEPVQSLVAQEEATPDAPQGDSRGAPNSADSALTNLSESASSTPANPQSTVFVSATATPASTAEPGTAPEAGVEALATIASAVADAPETQAVANAIFDPSAPPNVVTDVVSKVLSSVGLNPFASDNPVAPVDSPAMWAMLAWARKQEDVAGPSSFGRMFGDLEPLNQQTNEQLRLEAQKMLEEQPAIANPKGTTGGITFFGQFIDHDLTLDTLPQPDAPVDVNTLVNGRTFAFDLDSVYGGGPKKSPQLYNGDKFLIGTATDGVSPDLPRNADGSAILVEHRNDENLIIAQIHLSFLKLHNSLIDQGMSFDQARQTVIGAYRYVVLNDYLPQIVGQEAVNQALRQPVKAGFYDPGKGTPFTPVEFSVAAFRFGHSQIRNAYNINDASGGVPVFSLDGTADLHGGRQLPANLIIDFDNFFSELPQDGGPLLIGRAIDTNISQSLFQLPIPGAEGGGDNVLAFRNLLRAKFYDMPSGEAVAEAMGVDVVGDPLFPEGTPLWFYILREAEITSGGAELGPVGGGIVAEVFVDLLRQDSGYKTVEKPNLADVSGGDFRIGDLLVAADQPVEERPQPPAAEPCRDRDGRPTPGRAHEGSGRHRFDQLHRADERALERSGRHRLHQQLHRADDLVLERSGRHRLHQQLHGADN